MKKLNECGWCLVLGSLQFSIYGLMDDNKFEFEDIYLYGRLSRV